jgi:hypothetical protein
LIIILDWQITAPVLQIPDVVILVVVTVVDEEIMVVELFKSEPLPQFPIMTIVC